MSAVNQPFDGVNCTVPSTVGGVLPVSFPNHEGTEKPPATPKVPVDRGTHAGASAHLIPTEYDPLVAKLLQTPNRHITCSETLVEANIIDSTKGSVVILTNWSAGPIENLEITLPADLANKKLTTATGAVVQKDDNKVTLNLNIAEALILR